MSHTNPIKFSGINKNPRRKRTGYSPVLTLKIVPNGGHCVFLTLILHVIDSHRLITVLTYSASKISIFPKLTTPQLIFYIGTTTKYLSKLQGF